MGNVFFTHIGLAYVSLVLLLVRGVLSAEQVDWRQYKVLKIAPHVVDTLLLVSGGAVFFYFGLELQTWLVAKLVCLVLYIVLATKAFKRNQPFSLKHFLLAVIAFMAMMLLATLN